MRVRLIPLLILTQLACGSRYSASRCTGNPFPESQELLALPALSKLVYFSGKPSGKSPTDWEIWADAKFDFNVALKYYYTKADPKATDCPAAVTLEVKIPVTTEAQSSTHTFMKFFEDRLSTDFGSLRRALAQHAGEFQRRPPALLSIGTLVAEVSSIHHVNRGDFVILGFYEKSYYEAFLR
jgi:hypothetical protein